MPNDSLREEIEPIRRDGLAYIDSGRSDKRQRQAHLSALENCEARLTEDIRERSHEYLAALNDREAAEIRASRMKLEEDNKYKVALDAFRANQQTFEGLRQINGGGYPTNVPPILYIIPLLGIGLAEWYVNYETFRSMFIPVFAIAATIIVALVFAGASHIHGAFLKQISEIVHSSVESRHVLGRKIILIIATILLLAAFATVVWLRYLVIAEQLGLNESISSSTFGGASSSMIWSRVGPTIIINVLIWGLGTLYSWAMHEKVPDLRESYREFLRSRARLDRSQLGFRSKETQLKAHYERERDRNRVVIEEHKVLLADIQSTLARLRDNKSQ